MYLIVRISVCFFTGLPGNLMQEGGSFVFVLSCLEEKGMKKLTLSYYQKMCGSSFFCLDAKERTKEKIKRQRTTPCFGAAGARCASNEG